MVSPGHAELLYEERRKLLEVASKKQAETPHGVQIGQHGWEELYLTQDQCKILAEIEALLDEYYRLTRNPPLNDGGPPF